MKKNEKPVKQLFIHTKQTTYNDNLDMIELSYIPTEYDICRNSDFQE